MGKSIIEPARTKARLDALRKLLSEDSEILILCDEGEFRRANEKVLELRRIEVPESKVVLPSRRRHKGKRKADSKRWRNGQW